jgi:ABC-type amino acid transport substrate-binding protein
LAVLEAMPELASRHGLTLALTGYKSGKTQGDDVGKGALDAFFTCEVPAIQMMEGRADVRAVAAPGVLGRIAVVTRLDTIQALRGKRVGLAAGSTPAMDWQTWGAGLDATVVELGTDALLKAVQSGAVDAVVGWDPWVEDWLAKDPSLRVVAEREFRSVLAVSVPWSTGGSERARAFVALVEEAEGIAAADRPRWDAAVAQLSGWPVEVVRAVADRNAILSGKGGSLAWSTVDTDGLERAARFATQGRVRAAELVGLELLDGRLPAPRIGAKRGGGKGPPGVPMEGQPHGPPAAGGVPGQRPPGPPRPPGG